jgi:2-keto-4-pentenoate hydratase/2-oxohepta-3-ene-1,7-dioic acid hydratase in catechol pathway
LAAVCSEAEELINGLWQVLAPVPSPENPIICLGGNYKAHIEEAKASSFPKYET